MRPQANDDAIESRSSSNAFTLLNFAVVTFLSRKQIERDFDQPLEVF